MAAAQHTVSHSSFVGGPEAGLTPVENPGVKNTGDLKKSLTSLAGGLIEGGVIGAAISALAIGGVAYYLRTAEMFASQPPSWQQNVAEGIQAMLGIR